MTEELQPTDQLFCENEDQNRDRALLQGLKQAIEEELKEGRTPKATLAFYNKKLEIYKKKYGGQDNQSRQTSSFVRR